MKHSSYFVHAVLQDLVRGFHHKAEIDGLFMILEFAADILNGQLRVECDLLDRGLAICYLYHAEVPLEYDHYSSLAMGFDPFHFLF